MTEQETIAYLKKELDDKTFALQDLRRRFDKIYGRWTDITRLTEESLVRLQTLQLPDHAAKVLQSIAEEHDQLRKKWAKND